MLPNLYSRDASIQDRILNLNLNLNLNFKCILRESAIEGIFKRLCCVHTPGGLLHHSRDSRGMKFPFARFFPQDALIQSILNLKINQNIRRQKFHLWLLLKLISKTNDVCLKIQKASFWTKSRPSTQNG